MVSSSSAPFVGQNVISFGLVFQGLSFLDLRYQLLLFYLQDLTHLISLKTDGAKIKESDAIERAVTIRTVRHSTNTVPRLLYHITYYIIVCLKMLYVKCEIYTEIPPHSHQLFYLPRGHS